MLTINGGIPLKTEYKDLNFADLKSLLELQAKANAKQLQGFEYHLELIGIITGQNKDWIEQVEPEIIEDIMPYIEFLYEFPTIPNEVAMNGRVINLENINPEFKTYGAKLLYSRTLLDYQNGKVPFDYFCTMGAKIYLHSEIYEKYNEEEIVNLDVSMFADYELMLINDFFLRNLMNLDKKKANN